MPHIPSYILHNCYLLTVLLSLFWMTGNNPTWHCDTIHIGFKNKVWQRQHTSHFCCGHILSFPSENHADKTSILTSHTHLHISCPLPIYHVPFPYIMSLGAGIAPWLEHQTRDWKVAGSNPCWNGGRIFFSRVDFLCWLLFRYPFHPRVTTVARKKSRSFCQKVQVAGYS